MITNGQARRIAAEWCDEGKYHDLAVLSTSGKILPHLAGFLRLMLLEDDFDRQDDPNQCRADIQGLVDWVRAHGPLGKSTSSEPVNHSLWKDTWDDTQVSYELVGVNQDVKLKETL